MPPHRSLKRDDIPSLNTAGQMTQMEQQIKDLFHQLSQEVARNEEKDKLIEKQKRQIMDRDIVVKEKMDSIINHRQELRTLKLQLSTLEQSTTLVHSRPMRTVVSTQTSPRFHPYSRSSEESGPSACRPNQTIEQSIEISSREYASLCERYQSQIELAGPQNKEATEKTINFCKMEVNRLQNNLRFFQGLSNKLDAGSYKIPSLLASEHNKPVRKSSCSYCSEYHFSGTCPNYPTRVSRTKRLREIETAGRIVCRQCLSFLHKTKNCKSKNKCKNCNNPCHHTSLCPKNP